jgi:DNA repair protein RadC
MARDLKSQELQKLGERDDPVADPRPTPGEPPERWRLSRHGVRDLAVGELLTLVLGSGGPTPPAVLAQQLLHRFGDLRGIARGGTEALGSVPGLGLARASRLLAALELGRRLAEDARPVRRLVRGPADVAELLAAELRGRDREHFLGLYLDARHRLAAVRTISVGTLDASLVHPREVFLPAVGLQAAAVIVAHNHPSGCARPSGDDLELTRRLARCGGLLGIELLDHLVVGDEEIVSIREYGWPAAE